MLSKIFWVNLLTMVGRMSPMEPRRSRRRSGSPNLAAKCRAVSCSELARWRRMLISRKSRFLKEDKPLEQKYSRGRWSVLENKLYTGKKVIAEGSICSCSSCHYGNMEGGLTSYFVWQIAQWSGQVNPFSMNLQEKNIKIQPAKLDVYWFR